MSDHADRFSTRVFVPSERIPEVLFGLIMMLIFTGSLGVANASRGEAHTLFIGALGCNLEEPGDRTAACIEAGRAGWDDGRSIWVVRTPA